MGSLKEDEIKVRFKFQDQNQVYRAIMTQEQFKNLKEIPVLEYCEMVEKLGTKIESSDEERLREKLALVLKNDKSHVKSLSYD